MNDDEPQFERMMPLVLAKSEGGPYDDAALIAGLQLGYIQAMLEVLSTARGTETEPFLINKEARKQADLIAMQAGFSMLTTDQADDPDYDCMWVRFKKIEDPDEG